MKPKHVLLTGGEQSGKTPVANSIGKIFRREVLVIREMATMLLENGFPKPGKDIRYSPEVRDTFQRCIYECQVNFDAVYLRMAEERGIQVVIDDRGKLDGIVYRDEPDLNEAKARFCQEHGIDFVAELANYEMVVHFESIAVIDPAAFEIDGETFRVVPDASTDEEQRRQVAVQSALRLERRLFELYEPHPWRVVLPAKIGVEGKIANFSGMVRALLAMKE